MTTHENSALQSPETPRHDDLPSLTAALLRCVTPDEVVSVVMERGMAVLGAEAGLVALVTRDGQELEIVCSRGYAGEAEEEWPAFPVTGHFAISEAVRAGEPRYLENDGTDTGHRPDLSMEQGQPFRSSVSLPLSAHQRMFGAIHFSFAKVREFTPADRAFLDELRQQCAMALERAHLLEEVERTRRHQAEERERMLLEQERLVAELEKANAKQRKSLRASEERFRLLVEGVKDYAIFMLDPEGRIATWNAGAQRFKGYSATEIIGSHISRFYTEEDIASRHPWHELEIAVEQGRYEEEGWRIRKDGSRFWAHVIISALRDDTGALQGFAKVTRDVTERRIREKERAAAEMAEQQRRLLKDILAYVTEGRLLLCDTAAELPTLLGSGSEGISIPLSRSALKSVRSAVAEVAAHCHLPQERIQDLVTAASETAMNAVQHAKSGTCRVYGSKDPAIVQVWVEDHGTGIDLSNIPRATLQRGFSTGGIGFGHGFNLMLACCQRVYLLTGATGTTVVLEQEGKAPKPAWL